MRHTLLCAFLVFALSSAFGQDGSQQKGDGALSFQKGDYAFSVDSPGWTLHKDSGDRLFTTFIAFDKPFQSPPTLFVSMTTLDASTSSSNGVRIKVTTEKVTSGGFIIHVATWADSKVTGVMGSWIALGK